jgi:ketosteroid isomerase-like protein
MKRILEIGIYKPGELAFEVTNLDDVNSQVDGHRAMFTGHATVKSRCKGQDFSSLYQLTKVYEEQQGRWQIVASRTARVGDK